jgi:hypothetical protein
MRGDRMDMKRGYDYKAAALSAAQFKGLSEDQTRQLLDFARGFANGMAAAIEADDASVHYKRYEPLKTVEYTLGLQSGAGEAGFLLYPTLETT